MLIILKDKKIVVRLKYLSNFFRSLEMALINCKIHLELNWSNNSVMCNQNGETKFKITNIVIVLSTKDNVNLTKQLNGGFKRSIYWNEYKSKIETKAADNNNITRFPLDASFQVFKEFIDYLSLLLIILIMAIIK